MNKYMIYLSFLFIILGVLLANSVYTKYKASTVFNNNKPIYFVSLINNSPNLNSIPNVKDLVDDKEYIYLCITANKEIAIKIKDNYKERGYDTKVIDKTTTNDFFYSELEQYDILLNNYNSLDELNGILDAILASYKQNKNNL